MVQQVEVKKEEITTTVTQERPGSRSSSSSGSSEASKKTRSPSPKRMTESESESDQSEKAQSRRTSQSKKESNKRRSQPPQEGEGKEVKRTRKWTDTTNSGDVVKSSSSATTTNNNNNNKSTAKSGGEQERRKIRRNYSRSSVSSDTLEVTNQVVTQPITTNQESRILNKSDHGEDKENVEQEVVVDAERQSEVDTLQVVKEETPKVITNRKISFGSSSSSHKDRGGEDQGGGRRKRKWGSLDSNRSRHTIISTESLKGLIPDVQTATVTTLPSSSLDDLNLGITPMEITPTTVEKMPKEVEEIEEEEDETSKGGRSPSPARNPVSCVLHVRNLVRPFTLTQLKEHLAKTGKILEEAFWIDKIKSKCFVTYASEDEAVASRRSLHGSRWPHSNPKTLIVDFSNEQEVTFHKESGRPMEEPPPKEEVVRKRRESSHDPLHIASKRKNSQSEERRVDRPMREWDRGKLDQEESSRNQSRGSNRGTREKKRTKEVKVKAEETPGKLLDDLFRKTKAMPCIYWLPLTQQQIVVREDERRVRQAEREKRRHQEDQRSRPGRHNNSDRVHRGRSLSRSRR